MIEIVDLYKAFHDHEVLCGVNLTIQTGETMVVIGRSGCGKSVLLKHIIGLLRPERGSVVVDGTDVTKLPRQELARLRLKCGMLFQGAALFDSLTVAENVGFALAEHDHHAPADIRRRVAECLAMVGLEGIEELRPSQLSGGMRKRVGLARALCVNPQIILYDEPTTGIDPVMADAINTLIIELRDKLHVTSVAVTHDMTSAYKIADRIAMLYEGRMIAVGTPEEIRRSTNDVVRQFITGASTGPIPVEVGRVTAQRR